MIKLADYDFLAATPSSMAGWSAARGGGGGTGEATYFDAAGNLQVATAGQWRVDHDPVTLARRGLLLEPGRTNRVLNPRMEGAAAGTPGTIPTGLGFQVTGGLALTEIPFVGSESGIPCVDFRITGTTAGTGVFALSFISSASAAAVNNEIWTGGWYWRLVSGSGPNVWQIGWQEYPVAGTPALADVLVAVPAPTSAPLRSQRVVNTRTLAGGVTVAFVRHRLRLSVPAGTYDFTLRIGAPQLELGAFATSPILPPVGVTTAAATRAADQGSVPVTATSRATLYLEERTIAKGDSGSLGAVQADDGSANNRLNIAATGGTGYAPAITGSGTAIATFSTGSITDGVVDRAALAYAPNAMVAALDGASLGTDTSGSLAASINRIAITDGDRARHLRAIRLYAAGLTLAQVQAITLDGAEPSPVGISLPAIRRPAEAAERLVGLTQSHQSPFDGTLQTLEMPGARWEFTATWPVLGPDDRRLMVAFLSSLRGMAGRFFFSPAQWSPRRATGGGTPVIDGDFQAGTTLATRGWTALGQAMRAGDWLSYVDTRGRRRLHMVVADASADASGLAACLPSSVSESGTLTSCQHEIPDDQT
ncbi:hypothetical protein [Sandarakinorhabdus sp.]|uniref:hypothetical protein n=1 Tax=Sandarakinorhabdus sp. TaxID=1916663 RepID=UPI0028A63416|nr:hypothetical protein [Sandarakinorhabdus sp.]